MKTKRFYMHTLDGKPAGYDPNFPYLYFANKTIKASEMATSLGQLRKHQQNTHKGHDEPERGYRIIVVDGQ